MNTDTAAYNHRIAQVQDFLEDVSCELVKARRKFPQQDVWKTLAALGGEVGELNKAILQFHDEPEKGVTLNQIRREAVQVAVMAVRTILDAGL